MMPNVMNRSSKPNLMMKVEKENENKDIRRKLKCFNRVTFRSLSERSPGSQCNQNSNKETVWERLSKVKRSASNEGHPLVGTKSRVLVITKGSMHRLQPNRTLGQYAVRKPPLTTNTNHNKPQQQQHQQQQQQRRGAALNVKGKSLLSYPTKLGISEKAFQCKKVKSLKEIMSARSICNSKTSSDDASLKKISSNSEEVIPIAAVSHIDDNFSAEFEMDDRVMSSQDTLDDYVLAPLMPVPTRDALNSSAIITSNFRRLLHCRKKNMAEDEIMLVKDAVKSDERHRQLQPNDSVLFKEILKSQLKEIIHQETVLQSALHNLKETSLDADVDADLGVFCHSPTSIAIDKPFAVPATNSQQLTQRQKQQVDVIFKNVPTLEKEIIILKALGEKLEATLKRTVSQTELKSLECNKLRSKTFERKWYSVQIEDNMQYATIELTAKGIRRCVGIVREFRMEHKTIVELKEQANQHFYLPTNKNNSELKRTTFKHLKENPDLLMLYLKPKNTLVPLNVFEQDTRFFNSFPYTACVLGDDIESAVLPTNPTNDLALTPKINSNNNTVVASVLSEIYDSAQSNRVVRYNECYMKEPLQIEEIQCTLNVALCNDEVPIGNSEQKRAVQLVTAADNVMAKKKMMKEEKESQRTPNLSEAPVRGDKRRRIRQHHTPLPPDINPDPKFNLFKTILVGSMQISVFILLIMAITYPDIRC